MYKNTFGKAYGFSGHFLKQQISKTFGLHRDLKSCLSLEELELMVQSRTQQIERYGKTAFLQSLNNFPLSHSFKFITSALKIFLYANKLTNLSRYQQLLKYTIFSKLNDRLVNDKQKKEIQALVSKQEDIIIESIKENPFDTVDSMNFIIFQRQNASEILFYHSLATLKNCNYEQIESVLTKMIPVFLKRLNMNEWHNLRRFNYLVELLVYKYIPSYTKSRSGWIYILENISQMQLHLIGYNKIPPAIDYVYNFFFSSNKELDTIHFVHLTAMFKAFSYLPLGYNQTLYRVIYGQMLARSNKEIIRYNCLPYRRMSKDQIRNLFSANINSSNIMKILLYAGNNIEFRKHLLENDVIEELASIFFRISDLDFHTVISYILAAHILNEKYSANPHKQLILTNKFMAIILKFNKSHKLHNIKSHLSSHNLLNLMHLTLLTKNSQLYRICKHLSIEYMLHLQQKSKDTSHTSMLLQCVRLHCDCAEPEIRAILVKIIKIVLPKADKVRFYSYCNIIFQLMKSVYFASKEYQETVDFIFQLIKTQEIPFFVELFNAYPNKNFQLKTNILQLVCSRDQSFKSIGKFMVSSTFKFFTSNRGELTLDMRKKLQILEPCLNFADFQEFLLNQLNYIIRFCSQFFFYLSTLCRKLLLLVLNNIDLVKYKKEGLPVYLMFIEELINMCIRTKSLNKFHSEITSLIEKIKQLFDSSTYFKAKEIEWLTILNMINPDKKQLMLQEVISDLSNDNYPLKQYNTIVLLVKMNLVGAISLNEPLRQKFQYIIRSTAQQNPSKAHDLIRLLSLRYYKLGGLIIMQESNKQMQSILMKVLSLWEGKQTFEYYIELVDISCELKWNGLLKASVDVIAKMQLIVVEVTNLMKYLRYCQGINLDGIYSVLLNLSAKLSTTQINHQDLLYHLILAKTHISPQEFILAQTIIKEANRLIQRLINNKTTKQFKTLKNIQSFLYLKMIKHFWICISCDSLGFISNDIFQDFLNNVERLKEYRNLKEQFSEETLSLIYLTILKYVQANKAKLPQSQSPQQQPKKSFLKNSNRSHRNSENNNISELINRLSRNIITNHKRLDQNKLQQLQQILKEKGFEKRESEANGAENMYIANRIHENIILDVWLKNKEKVQYGILYLDEKYLIDKDKLNGKARFVVTCYQILTGFKILTYLPGRELVIQ